MTRYVWCSIIGKRGFYCQGFSRSHSRKIWKALPEFRRQIQRSLRSCLSTEEKRSLPADTRMACYDPKVIFGASR
jgi:hypothetical protein